MELIDRLIGVVGEARVIRRPEQLRTYESDGLTSHRVVPAAVVLPETTAEVAAAVRVCADLGVPFVARGAGTGLSGGAVPVSGGIVISLARMNRILSIDLANERAVVQPGVINLHISQRLAADGYFFAPDPSSQSVCTIGGNVAENSGGAHCLKYGFTTNHVVGLTVVLPDGAVVTLGGAAPGEPGYDLVGVFVGAEGTLGIATEIVVRIVRRPAAVELVVASYSSTDDAGAVVSDIIAAGILPAAIEMMDSLSIQAAEKAVHAGYPAAGALLLVEIDGEPIEVASLTKQVEAICRTHNAETLVRATDPDARALLWKGRKSAFAAMGRISPSYYVQDGVVPRTALPAVLRRIRDLSAQYGLRVANVFHAGDGNLHPLVLYDAAAGESDRAHDLAAAILHACIDSGGSITGEHGVGLDKKGHLPKMFSAADLDTMQILRCAFDPRRLSNPDKVFPTPRLCGERPGPGQIHPLVAAGQADLF